MFHSKKNRKKIKDLWHNDLPLVLMLAGLTIMGGVFWFYSILILESGVVALFDQVIIIWSFLLSFLFLGERATLRSLLGLGTALVGLVLVIKLGGDIPLLPILGSLGATFSIAVQSILLKKMGKNTDPIALTFIRGWLIVIFTGFIFGGLGLLMVPDSWLFVILVFISQIFGLCLARGAYITAHQHLPVFQLSAFNLLIPVFTMIGAYFWFGEAFTQQKILGGSLILLGLGWYLWWSQKKEINV